MDNPVFTSVQLERMTFAVQQYITEELAADFANAPQVKLHSHVDFMVGGMVVELRQHIYGRIAEQEEVKYPADWWEAFKGRWFPAWAKERWPVRYRWITLTARELYPMVKMPRHKHAIVIQKVDHGEVKDGP